MAHDYWVDKVNGHDPAESTPGNGTQANPWRTVAPALAALTYPIVVDTTVHLVGDVTQTQNYDYGSLELHGVQCLNNSHLYWQPDPWNDANYNSGNDPFSASSSPPRISIPGPKPAMFSAGVVIDGGSNNIVFRGIRFNCGAAFNPQVPTVTAGVDEGSRATFVYCGFENFTAPSAMGVGSTNGSTVDLENVYIYGPGVGIAVMNGSAANLTGGNVVHNCGWVGVLALADSRVTILPGWTWVAQNMGPTIVITQVPRAAYKAVWASASKIIIADLSPLGVPVRGQLRIMKNDLHENDNYLGVVLEAQSLLQGAKLVTFADPNFVQTNPTLETVPAGQQIVLKAGEGSVRVE